jgi:hypothetical protein
LSAGNQPLAHGRGKPASNGKSVAKRSAP